MAMMSKTRTVVLAALATAALTAGLMVTPASAAQIFVQQSGTSPAGGDPNVITNMGSFVVGVAGSSSTTLQNPLLVIVGVLNGNGIPAISYSGGVSTATVGTYGLASTTATFRCTNAGCTNTAFHALGLAAGGSESFVNWSGKDLADGFGTATSYSLYAFALSTSLTSGSPITIDESGAANGSFIIAYDCKAGTGSSTGCKKSGDIAQTVFTNTGLVDAVPEPGSLLLLGTGLAGLGLMVRRRRRG